MNTRPLLPIAIGIAVLILGQDVSFAASSQFTNSNGTGLWSDAANWSAGIPGGPSDIAFLNVPGAGEVILDYVAPSVQYILVGQGGGSGSLGVQAGANLLISQDIRVGQDQLGAYNQSGGVISTTGAFTIGLSSGSAGSTATVSSGTLNVGGDLNVSPGAATSMSVAGGSVTVNGTTNIGVENSSGTLLIQGGQFSTNNMAVGSTYSPHIATLTIGSGADFEWSADGAIDARANSGKIEILGSTNTINGGLLLVNSGAEIEFILDASGLSSVVLASGSAFLSGSILTIDGTAFSGAGTFTLFDSTGLTGSFSTINYLGFAPDSASVTTDANGMYLTVVPEPATTMLLGLGVIGLVVTRCLRTRYAR